jgi:DDE superfamily endonuclease
LGWTNTPEHTEAELMNENTTSSATPQPDLPPLLSALWRLLRAHRDAFKQERTFLRAQALIFGHLFCFARRTITQALLALGLTDQDWSAFYRLFGEKGRIDYEALTGRFFLETLPHVSSSEPYVAVVDGVQLPRHSHKMPGTSWLRSPTSPPFMPGIHRAQRFMHLAGLVAPNGEGYFRALPLRWEPAFTHKAVEAEGFEPKKEWEAGLRAMEWLRGRLDEAGRRTQKLLMVADGTYCVKDLFRELPERVTLLARCAKNRALYEVPDAMLLGTGVEGEKPSSRGRPRKYGERARRPSEWLEKGKGKRKGWRTREVVVRGRAVRLRHRVEGPYLLKGAPERAVYLIVVKGVDPRSKRRRRREPSFFLVSAAWREDDGWTMPLSAENLLFWAWQRWEVEVCHREMKTGFGLGEMQCFRARSTVMAARWQAWSYGVMVLAGIRAWGLGRGPIRPPGRWWGGSGRWSMGTLWRGYRKEMWGTEPFRALWSPTGGGYYEKEALLAGLGNSVSGSLRG